MRCTWVMHEAAVEHRIQVRDLAKTWDECETHEFGAEETSAEIGGLYPTSCFEFRLVVVTKEGDIVSDIVECETLKVGCGGKEKKRRESGTRRQSFFRRWRKGKTMKECHEKWVEEQDSEDGESKSKK